MLRPLGAIERVFHLWSQRNPLHFSIVAELEGLVEPEAIRSALDQIVRRHPLLNTVVVNDDELGPVFYRSAARPKVRVSTATDWQRAVAEEMGQPLGVEQLLRATLLGGQSSTLILTFQHTVADGVSAVGVLSDLLDAIGGRHLEDGPVPPSQEELLMRSHRTAGDEISEGGEVPPDPPPWMSVVGARRSFDGATPEVSMAALDRGATRVLVETSRSRGVTVHSVLCAAVSQVLIRTRSSAGIRIFSPLSLRHLIDPGHGTALYTSVIRTGLAAAAEPDLWSMARATHAQLAGARTASSVSLVASATEAMVPPRAGVEDAEAFMLGGMSFEAEITNLGVVDLPARSAAGAPSVRALWGPVVLNQVAGEIVISVNTYHGVLRMTACSHNPLEHLPQAALDLVVNALQV